MKRIVLLILVALLTLQAAEGIQAKERTSPLVIVLDPGHDTTHSGAGGHGLREEKLNLKIAQYCLEELSTYNNVEVHMTRYAESCPHTGATTANDNLARVEFAESVNADVYVSLHLNAEDTGRAKGVEIFYPNTSYRSALSTEGKGLATSILNELTGLGLYNRGVLIRNAETSRYEDGSIGDYYQVIREAKKRNIPGIIVEHAFISSESDATNFLSTEAQLKALGKADATGIAKYYGLSKKEDAKTEEYTVTFMYGDTVVSTQKVAFGQAATRPDAAKDGMYTVYDKSFSYITEDIVIFITYEPIEKPEDTTEDKTDPPTSEEEKDEDVDTEGTEVKDIDTETSQTEDTQIEDTQIQDTQNQDTEAGSGVSTEAKGDDGKDTEVKATQASGTDVTGDAKEESTWGILIVLMVAGVSCIAVITVLFIQLLKNKKEIGTEE